MDEARQEQAQSGLCAAGCGFFGCAETGNMCSKCWREEMSRKLAETDAMPASVPAAVPESLPESITVEAEAVEEAVSAMEVVPADMMAELSAANPPPLETKAAPREPAGLVAEPAQEAEAARSEAKRSAVDATTAPKKKKKNRCGVCDKKVGLAAIKCRCNLFFCSTHRYPECHDCSFDYKATERAALAGTVTGGGQFARITKI